MKSKLVIALIFFLTCVILAGCGPSQAELDATATQEAVDTFAAQTALAPTATATSTPSPTPTVTPTPTNTFTPTPTDTPTLTPTPTPQAISPENAAQIAALDTLQGFEGVARIIISAEGVTAIRVREEGTLQSTLIQPQLSLPGFGAQIWAFGNPAFAVEPYESISSDNKFYSQGPYSSPAFSEGGNVFASQVHASDGVTIAVWQIAEDLSLQPVIGNVPIYDDDWIFNLSPDGRYLACVSKYGFYYEQTWSGNCPFTPCYFEITYKYIPAHGYIYQLPEGTLVSELDTSVIGPYAYRSIFSPDNTWLVTLYSHNYWTRVQLWRVADGKVYRQFDELPKRGDASSLAFSPDGELIALIGGGKLHLWQWEPDTTLWSVEGTFSALDYSPNGNLLVTGAVDGSVQLWQASDGGALATLSGHGSKVTHVAFSPDGSLLASLDESGVLILWGMPR